MNYARFSPRRITDTELVAGLLHEYRDELTKEACDNCEHCGAIAMCSFHSLLSTLNRETWLTAETQRWLDLSGGSQTGSGWQPR